MGCLFLITYRTLIAFFSESKAVTIQINRYGEQYLDMLSLIIIWIICLVGFIILLKVLKEEKAEKTTNDEFERRPTVNENGGYFDIEKNINVDVKTGEVTGIVAESSNDMNQKLYNDD